MQIRIRYFASFRDVMGVSEESLSTNEGATISTVRQLLQQREPRVRPLMERSLLALNAAYVSTETELHEGDELVFIPPMGGGQSEGAPMEPIIQLTREPLQREELIAAVSHSSIGGIVVFEGVVRDHARGKSVRYLEYEIYEEMARKQIGQICEQARQRWGVERIAVAHRTGRLEIGEASVIIVVASPHRAEAFEVCRYLIDTLKATVPIWKKEVAVDGEEWVEG